MSSKIVEAVYRLELNRHQLELNGGSRYLLDLAMLPFLINGYESMPDLARVSLQSCPGVYRVCVMGGVITL